MKRPIAVFDLDGTLVHTAPDLVASINHALAFHGHRPTEYSELQAFAGTGGRGMLKQFTALRGIKLTEPQVLAILATFLAHYEATIPGTSTLYDGALAFVTSLRNAGYKTAICTNKPQFLANLLLVKLDLAQHFDAICGADFFTFKKPDPRHLNGTIEAAAGDPTRAIMFGDSQTDFDTAIAANIPIVGVTFGYSPVPVSNFNLTKIISHYTEIDLAQVDELIGR
jgi:phosphoglycolate phosphatase